MPATGRRKERLADSIKRRVSEALLRDLRDPHLGFVTVTGVDVSGDLRVAQVYVTVLGDEQRAVEALRALRRAQGFLERTLFRELRLKRPVEVRFHPDEAAGRAARIEAILRNLRDAGPGEEAE